MNIDGYERTGRALYQAFASAVAEIVDAAIREAGGYHLQQVATRAKDPDSLRRKLALRGIDGTGTVETEIKDLAGCRIVFYTNSDVSKFVNSGIVDDNFHVVDRRVHHPTPFGQQEPNLYISNHYTVELSPERSGMPEYGRFRNLRCEIQVQTILNHAWAEMAHDTIYKTPLVGDFGAKSLERIRERLHAVARKYLLPAGYEFQKIAHDFERLVAGQALFDREPLQKVVEAPDNNIRVEILESYVANVLPFYDAPEKVYPEVVDALVKAVERSLDAPPEPIRTPFGDLSGKTTRDVLEQVTKVLKDYRYLDTRLTFDAVRTLYASVQLPDERKLVSDVAESLAEHNLQVWRQYGPAAQVMLVERIKTLTSAERCDIEPLLTVMLAAVLSPEVKGTTSTSKTMTIHRGTVTDSADLRQIRADAIEALKELFATAVDGSRRRAILIALHSATRHPRARGLRGNLDAIIARDARCVIEFEAGVVASASFDVRQWMEARAIRLHWTYRNWQQKDGEEPGVWDARRGVVEAALLFKEAANRDPEFGIYKTLVGYESVFPPAWEDPDFEREQADEYRRQQVGSLVESVTTETAAIWRARMERCAQTPSDDAATFPVFADFLQRVATQKPEVVLDLLPEIGVALARFLPALLAGLMSSSERLAAASWIDGCVFEGKHLSAVGRFLEYADPFDESLLRRALGRAIETKNTDAVLATVRAAVRQFSQSPGGLIDGVFLPGLRYLKTSKHFGWVQIPWFSWRTHRPILRALDRGQAKDLLAALAYCPRIETDAEVIVSAIAERWPDSVIDFFSERLAIERSDGASHHFDAIPFDVHELKVPLASVPDVFIRGARAWFDADPRAFRYDGARLVAQVFPDFDPALRNRLVPLVEGENEDDLRFVLGILSAYEGAAAIYEIAKEIVRRLGPESPLLDDVNGALEESGTVSGEFGFSRLYAERKSLIELWLHDSSDRVRRFAQARSHSLEQMIAAHTRSAEASIAMRRLEWGEDIAGEPPTVDP